MRELSAQNSQHRYRIDKFKVPPASREEFLKGVRDTQSFLATLPGFIGNALFEQSSGPSVFNFVTMVEWESAEAIERAAKAVTTRFEGTGFNPQATRSRFGIEADVAIYREAPTAPLE